MEIFDIDYQISKNFVSKYFDLELEELIDKFMLLRNY